MPKQDNSNVTTEDLPAADVEGAGSDTQLALAVVALAHELIASSADPGQFKERIAKALGY